MKKTFHAFNIPFVKILSEYYGVEEEALVRVSAQQAARLLAEEMGITVEEVVEHYSKDCALLFLQSLEKMVDQPPKNKVTN